MDKFKTLQRFIDDSNAAIRIFGLPLSPKAENKLANIFFDAVNLMAGSEDPKELMLENNHYEVARMLEAESNISFFMTKVFENVQARGGNSIIEADIQLSWKWITDNLCPFQPFC